MQQLESYIVIYFTVWHTRLFAFFLTEGEASFSGKHYRKGNINDPLSLHGKCAILVDFTIAWYIDRRGEGERREECFSFVLRGKGLTQKHREITARNVKAQVLTIILFPWVLGRRRAFESKPWSKSYLYNGTIQHSRYFKKNLIIGESKSDAELNFAA